MAIGLGRMFGFKFPENFNYPYISKSAAEFWRRWHISLGSWFRDYVYIPLGGSRVPSKARLVLNLSIVWLLTGIWHGANWTFICWGMFYFVFITFEKLTGFEKLGLPDALKHVYLMLIVLVGWVLFRADTIADAAEFMRIMFGFAGKSWIDANTIVYLKENLVYLIFGIVFSTPTAKIISAKAKEIDRGNMIINAGYVIVFTGIFLLTLSYLVKGAYNPFIYFNF
jgi:D-alanyl-lipoteichoic acid acyltransferase DltB (MBOAT superfamily)